MKKRVSSILTLLMMILVLFGGTSQAVSGLDIDEIIKAAERGDAEAQYQLGVIYVDGEGVAKNAVKAYAWFSLAAGQGVEDAAKKRDSIAVTPEQRRQAEDLVSELELQVKSDKPMRRYSSLQLIHSSTPPIIAKQPDIQAWLKSIKPAAGGE